MASLRQLIHLFLTRISRQFAKLSLEVFAKNNSDHRVYELFIGIAELYCCTL